MHQQKFIIQLILFLIDRKQYIIQFLNFSTSPETPPHTFFKSKFSCSYDKVTIYRLLIPYTPNSHQVVTYLPSFKHFIADKPQFFYTFFATYADSTTILATS